MLTTALNAALVFSYDMDMEEYEKTWERSWFVLLLVYSIFEFKAICTNVVLANA